MIGREAYDNPWLYADVDELYFGTVPNSITRSDVALEMIGVFMENAIYWDAVRKSNESRRRKINLGTKKRLMKDAEERSKKILGVKRRRYNLPLSFFSKSIGKRSWL